MSSWRQSSENQHVLLRCHLLAGTELSADAGRGVSSPFVSAGFVWAVRQSVYASNRSHDVTNTSLGRDITDVCHFLLSKLSPYPNSRDFGLFGTFSTSFIYLVICVHVTRSPSVLGHLLSNDSYRLTDHLTTSLSCDLLLKIVFCDIFENVWILF